MQRKVLESLVARGAIIGLILPETGHSLAEIESLGDALSPEHLFIIDCGTHCSRRQPLIPRISFSSRTARFLAAFAESGDGTQARRRNRPVERRNQAKDSDVRRSSGTSANIRRTVRIFSLLQPGTGTIRFPVPRGLRLNPLSSTGIPLLRIFFSNWKRPLLLRTAASADFRRYPTAGHIRSFFLRARPFAKLKLPPKRIFSAMRRRLRKPSAL